MRAEYIKRDDAQALVELGAASDLTQGDPMPFAWEGPLLKDTFES